MQANEALKIAVQKIESAGIKGAALDARVLLEFATGKNRTFFLANPNAQINEAEFFRLVERRVNREPVSHITGKKEFYGREFIVSADVLTPRPETELIIDTAKDLFETTEPIKILELGVGSGCIIITLMEEYLGAIGVGVDISEKALAIARKNAYNLGITGIEFYCSDWAENIGTDGKKNQFDLVVSNPPYIKADEKNSLEAELGFEPDIALYAGRSGLDAYEKIAKGLGKISFRYAIFEIGQGQETEVEKIFNENGFKLIEQKKDLAGIIRTLVFAKK